MHTAKSTLLEKFSPIFRQRQMLSLPRFGHFLARKMAAGKSSPPSGTLLDFLLWDRHSLLEFLWLGDPAATLFITRDTCSDSIALKSNTLQNGVSHRCACAKLSTKRGYCTILGECWPPWKILHDMGYHSDSIAISRDMGPLRLHLWIWCPNLWSITGCNGDIL